MSEVVSVAGAVPLGAEMVGACPAIALTVGSAPFSVELSDIVFTPRNTRPDIARTMTIARALLMRVMVAEPTFHLLPLLS